MYDLSQVPAHRHSALSLLFPVLSLSVFVLFRPLLHFSVSLLAPTAVVILACSCVEARFFVVVVSCYFWKAL